MTGTDCTKTALCDSTMFQEIMEQMRMWKQTQADAATPSKESQTSHDEAVRINLTVTAVPLGRFCL